MRRGLARIIVALLVALTEAAVAVEHALTDAAWWIADRAGLASAVDWDEVVSERRAP